MSREEKISHLKDILSEINENDNAVCYLTSEDNELIKSAIEALEQESCEDTISRKDALKALDYDIKSFEFKSGIGRHMNEIADLLNTIYEIQSDNIKALLPVQPKPKTGHWIPVSERLPEESDYVSCLPFYDGVVIWLTDKGIMGFGWYYNSTNNWADTNDCWSDKYGEVIAWMSLPEPYKPQESEG